MSDIKTNDAAEVAEEVKPVAEETTIETAPVEVTAGETEVAPTEAEAAVVPEVAA